MQAKSKLPYPVQAFTGLVFVGYEWRNVPDGGEGEAKRLEAAGVLELDDTAVSNPEIEEPEVPETPDEPEVDEPEPTLSPDLDDMTVVKLKELARERGLTGFSNMNKAELIDALKDD